MIYLIVQNYYVLYYCVECLKFMTLWNGYFFLNKLMLPFELIIILTNDGN